MLRVDEDNNKQSSHCISVFRAELEAEAEAALRAASSKLDLALLLPVLRGFVVRLALLPLLLSGPTGEIVRCVQIGRCVSEDISAGSALRDSLDWVTDDESGDFLSELVRTPTPDTMRLQIRELRAECCVCAVVVRSLSVVRPHGVGRGRPGAADGARIGRQHLI